LPGFNLPASGTAPTIRGGVHLVIDNEMRRTLETKLIVKITQFDITRAIHADGNDLPPGEPPKAAKEHGGIDL
jgi:hypothetical protein